ncbi:phospholipase [Streptomyces sp. ISL-96]|uniref:phospholipase A2 n=1 Tax=Streptomyces sp. ISL-96 TaxID=2819191 RepID=UPI001BE9162A|nr:phospholipase A2 [Streptomyces sp. ISL-96]MBT2491805.1 phospholipase [Streptomyces sp. ISL-96]
MTTLRNSISGAALTSVLVLTAVTPALADSARAAEPLAPQATKAQKLSKMKSVTAESAASQDRWFAALGKRNTPSIKKYRFTWDTDSCSWAPDKLPGGYDLKFPCWRHDFGYRNYKRIIGAPAFRRDHKKRVDKAFLHDMNRVCDKFVWADPFTPAQRKELKANCKKTAKKYYSTVRSFN